MKWETNDFLGGKTALSILLFTNTRLSFASYFYIKPANNHKLH